MRTADRPPKQPESMPWKISSRMLEDIAAENSETYRRIFEATFYRPRYVVDDTLFAKTELPEDGGLPYPRDYAYEELQVWRQRTGRLKSTLTYEGDPKTWGRPQK